MDNDAIPDDYAAWANQPPPDNVHHLANDPDMMTIDIGIGRGEPKPQPATNDAKPLLISGRSISANKAPIDWTVYKFLESSSLMSFYGASGAGKSFVIMHMALCIASGRDFFGQAVKQGAVIYIAGEGRDGIARRFNAWAQGEGVEVPDHIYVNQRPINMPSNELELIEAANQLASSIDEPIRLIVFDTLLATMDGNPINADDMEAFIRSAMRGIRDRYDCAVCVVTHTGHENTNREAFSKAFRNAVDFAYQVSEAGQSANGNKVINLESRKAKEGALESVRGFEFNVLELEGYPTDEEGNLPTSVYLSEIPQADISGIVKQAKDGRKAPSQTQALRIYDELRHLHQENLTDGGYSPEEARVSYSVWANKCLEAGLGGAKGEKWRFTANVEKRLVANGKLIIKDGFVYEP